MNEEILAKARTARSPEELLKLAQECGIEGITEENAGEYFKLMRKSGEIPDDELKGTSGGAAYDSEGCLIVTEGNLCRQRNKKASGDAKNAIRTSRTVIVTPSLPSSRTSGASS